ncbi:MAG: terminase small subunit [Solidesulfovibrio sp. DCME]|uniref:terminase small subunit n=1 Tax=Solidesulfovibrio sp. DCME TaxID=3447380 RepID=UPI003D137112
MPAKSDPKRLTDRQRRFVEEYLVDLKAGAAAIRAGYSEKSAETLGARLRNLPHVRDAIEAAMTRRSRRTGITQDRVVAELARIAFADIRDFVDWDESGVTLRAARELGPQQTACVAEIVETPGKGLRIKLHGKPQALAALSRHLGTRDKPAADTPQPTSITVITSVPPPDPAPLLDDAACPADRAGEGSST